jgi:hypothetical protein
LGIRERADPREAVEIMKKKYLYKVSISPHRKNPTHREPSKFKQKLSILEEPKKRSESVE